VHGAPIYFDFIPEINHQNFFQRIFWVFRVVGIILFSSIMKPKKKGKKGVAKKVGGRKLNFSLLSFFPFSKVGILLKEELFEFSQNLK